MTTPVSDLFRPLTFKEICATQILSSNSDENFSENAQRVFNNDILNKLWNCLKKKVPHGVLNFPIQVEEIEQKHRFQPDFCIAPLNLKTSLYFRTLAQTFCRPFKEAGLEKLINHRVPVACHEYLQLQEILKKKWEDEALCTLWKRGIFSQLEGVPKLETPNEIRLWMNDPANALLLLSISYIKIPDRNMKAIPPEIARLSNLVHLDLSENAIVIIDPLSRCLNLEHLDLSNNRISRCETLQKCTKISFLDLSMNFVSDPTPLASLSELTELYLDDNRVSNIAPICELKKLRILNLSQNQIAAIDAIGELDQLIELYLSKNVISRIDSIVGCVWLETLYLDSNTISVITPVGECTRLQVLNLGNNEISEIDILSRCKQLHTLHLSSNTIKKIDSLRECSELVTVTMNDNEISTLAPLTSPRLRKLCAASNKISSIDSFIGHTALRVLQLSMNKIPRVDSLAVCCKLTSLDLRKNKISEITPLANLPLKQLTLNNNPISISNPFSYLQRLQKMIHYGCLHLFLVEKDIAIITGPQLTARRSYFSEYTCLSSASHFLKIIALEKFNIPKIKEAFRLLESDDKCLINDVVCGELTFLGTLPAMMDENSFLSADILFSDIDLLQRAAKKALMTKFDNLTEKNKQRVYREIHDLANSSENQWGEPYASEVREEVTKILWGKDHAFISPLLLADALANTKPLYTHPA